MLPPQVAADIVSYKIFVSGKSGVGKTALVAKLMGLEVPSMHHETTGDNHSGTEAGVKRDRGVCVTAVRLTFPSL